MPKRTDLKTILIIGSGPIVIGQACEFDYSGTQACKALKEEGYKVVLVNSNPATIMTDPESADVTYIEPLTPEVLEKIIAKERPDALLPTLGGQTGLNLSLKLSQSGILKKYDVELIGAKEEAIEKGEDREKFREAMLKIGLDIPQSAVVHDIKEAIEWIENWGKFPVIIRPSYTLGGTGGGIAYNREEYESMVTFGLSASPVTEVLVEECLLGWKEFEMEVMRDHKDQCVVICSIENFDPMGVHTGDSITIAPAMTLTDREYQFCGNPRNRRRNGRFEYPVCGRPQDGAHDCHRDESARFPQFRAGFEGDGLPDCEDCRKTRGRLFARRAAQRHHARNPRELRADNRLRCNESSPFHF